MPKVPNQRQHVSLVDEPIDHRRAAGVTSAKRFGALPARAARDMRLGARHWRALTVIALHDQLDKNGAGCWASQRRLADLLGVDETQLSHTLTDLRDFGYIVSTISPKDRRQRVHRILYNEQDNNWDRDACRPQQVSRSDTCEMQDKSLRKTEQILAKNGGNTDASENDLNSLGVGTYVNIKEHTKKTALIEETDCAEAHSQSKVTEAKAYLTETEALAASSDRNLLKFERVRIAQIAGDACLPEELNERAARLLSLIDR
jgi:DNA-binding MarR family transcriptional regulator